MSKEQAFDLIVKVCSSFNGLNMENALKLKEALELLGKELFPMPIEESKDEIRAVLFDCHHFTSYLRT